MTPLTGLEPLPLAHGKADPMLVTREGNRVSDNYPYVETGAARPNAGGYSLGLSEALAELALAPGPLGVRLLPTDDARALAPVLSRVALVEVVFPGYRDGRGYSTARILREDLGYTGPMRAVGDVLRDQLFLMLRCGFDEFALKDQDPEQALEIARARFRTVYQSAADARRAAHQERLTGAVSS
ncbi:MAG: DUF934 domain-containing protein [Asticcacaulis sp.]